MIPINLAEKENTTPEYLEKQPFGQVPILDDNGYIIYGEGVLKFDLTTVLISFLSYRITCHWTIHCPEIFQSGHARINSGWQRLWSYRQIWRGLLRWIFSIQSICRRPCSGINFQEVLSFSWIFFLRAKIYYLHLEWKVEKQIPMPSRHIPLPFKRSWMLTKKY